MLFFYQDVDAMILKLEDIALEIFELIHGESPDCALLLAKTELLECTADRLCDVFKPVFRPDDRRLRGHLYWMKSNLGKGQWRSSQGDAIDFVRQDIPILKRDIRQFFSSHHYVAFASSPGLRAQFPEVYAILDEGYRDLYGIPPAQDYLAKVGYACRDALKRLATAIHRLDLVPPGEVPPTDEQYRNKIRQVLRNKMQSTTTRNLLEAELQYAEALITYANATGHNTDSQRAHVERALLHTYFLVEAIAVAALA